MAATPQTSNPDTYDPGELLTVLDAFKRGDFSKRMPTTLIGLPGKIADTMNDIIDMAESASDEFERVATLVGKQGKVVERIEMPSMKGSWQKLVDSTNALTNDLVSPMNEMIRVVGAVAEGDMAQAVPLEIDGLELQGQFLKSAQIVNTMVARLSTFSSEVTRVAREVGTDGKLGGQAEVGGVSGSWRDLTDSVNGMAANLTTQVRNIADVTTAVARGDLSRKITVEAKGEILELKNTVNTMVDQLSTFAAEVTRLAREVGTEGKLGGQATVAGVSGIWKDLTDNVNLMVANLTTQVRSVAEVATAVAKGDLSKRITAEAKGEFLELKNNKNFMVDSLSAFASEVTRVAREVGTEGKLGGQASVPGAAGTWKDLTESVNAMAGNLTVQLRDVSKVATAIAGGDLTQKITVDVKGEILQIKDVTNRMVDQLSTFAAEVTRVAREVGTEGKLGGQAMVRGVSGTWKDLTDNVNFMAANLTNQVRGIAKVVTAVAMGDLKKRLTVEAKGEIAELADTINNMTDTLALFSDQVTSVAREVGVEGKLGGQANVPGAAGTWKDLTENVNGLAANLTNQVRAIADVATSVTKGDLTRSIQVEAKGEVADLKDNVNEMIRNLRETTRQNAEQDWLKTNLAKFTRMLQGQRDLATVSRLVLSELAPLINGQHGVFYMMDDSPQEETSHLVLLSAYAFKERKNLANAWRLGEGLVGQCALEKQRILLTNVPADYISITSGLGEAKPMNIIVLPIVFENRVKAVIEIASFTLFSSIHQSFLDQLGESIGIVLNTIEANMRTEELLKQSQSLAQELQSQQEELRQTNEELEEKARLLEEQKVEVERKNREVETAKLSLEEKAEQLSLTSKYKSQFLSNMSHELRTPLNSLLLLAQQLADNPEGNLGDKQVQYARTIHGSGKDLLTLINEILDLSKIESGTVSLDLGQVSFREVCDQIDRTFRHMADGRGLGFTVELDGELPDGIYTDEKRLLQVLKNLLSNAFKFTERGSISMRVAPAMSGWSIDHPVLSRAGEVIGFYITDTGIGIPTDKQKIIFEAFQQADAGTSRKYGGTGLGLSISREIARLLGGELRLVRSEPGAGSVFVLLVPDRAPETAGGPGGGRQTPHQADKEPGPQAPPESKAAASAEGSEDDRAQIQPGDRVLLIVEDDARFAGILLQAARERGFKGVVCRRGTEVAPSLTRFAVTAITLDIHLPDMDGWVLLEQIKRNPDTRHIPVEIISIEDNRPRGRRFGAFDYLLKPVTSEAVKKALADLRKYTDQPTRDLLLVDNDEKHRQTIVELIGNGDVHIKAVANGKAALAALQQKRYDCMVLDLNLADMPGLDLIEAMQTGEVGRDVPVLVYGETELPEKDQERLRLLASQNVVKEVRTPERLLDETALFLHRVIAKLPKDRRQMLEKLRVHGDRNLAGKRVLVVDDDMRNIFALTSALERNRMEVVSAENGKSAIEILKSDKGIDIVLMDIMMPEMDGYETLGQIRKIKKFKRLPIIALTAKAMKGDREKCLEAGASDYVSKPVDVDQLLSLLRVWLYR